MPSGKQRGKVQKGLRKQHKSAFASRNVIISAKAQREALRKAQREAPMPAKMSAKEAAAERTKNVAGSTASTKHTALREDLRVAVQPPLCLNNARY